MADDRTYIKLHDGMPDHPKVDGLSDAAFRLLITMWCWCSRHLTDGYVPASTWTKRGTARARMELLDIGLAVPTDGGVRMHDYLQHQRSAAEVAELREKRRLAGSKGGKVKASRLASARASAVAKPKQTRSKPVAETEEVPTGTSQAETENPPGGALALRTDTAQTIIGEWISRCRKRPPQAVIGQVSRHVKALLEEGIDPDDVRRGLAAWMTKDVHPSVLPSLVNAAMNTRNDKPTLGDKAATWLALAESRNGEVP